MTSKNMRFRKQNRQIISCGKKCSSLPLSRSMTELTINPTNSRNPTDPIIEKDINLFIRKRTNPRFGLDLMPQIKLMESCISLKTPEAPINKKIPPRIVAKTFPSDNFTFLIASCICMAASFPTTPLIWPKICPRTASSPKKKPQTEIMMMKRGAQFNRIILDKSIKCFFQ